MNALQCCKYCSSDVTQTMKNKQRTYKAFTLIELVVAIALLVMVLTFASTIFKVSINAHRTAMANAEIMQKLRAITDQLNADFKGRTISPPGKVSFGLRKSNIDGQDVEVRSDCIMFFANGDFQSSGQDKGKTVVGNVAGIFYGQVDPNSSTVLKPKEKILARRQTILTADSSLTNFDLNPPREYCNSKPLSELVADYAADPNNDDMKNLVKRPILDLSDANDLVMYMAKGVDDFTIQFAEWDEIDKKFKWKPEKQSEFKEYESIYTRAWKFTFTLYDSKGIIEKGRTFTHIIYIGS